MINYKPVLPSSLLSERQDIDMNYKRKVNDNLTLKVGVVVEIIETTNPINQSGYLTEYHVMVVEEDNTSIYKHCMAIDSFGGIADYMRIKKRVPKDPKKVKNSGSLKNQEGTIVLLLCLEGSAEQAIIVGSLAHPGKKDILTEEKGHHLEGEFNGINWQINKDGELIVKFNSASESDGKYTNEEAGGSYLSMDKEGSIEANDGNKESIKIDKTNKTIALTAEADISNTTDANYNITAKQNISAKTEADLLVEATGMATLKSTGAFGLMSEAAMEIKGASLKVVADGAMMVEASSVEVKAPSITLGQGGSPALTASLQVLGIGNLGSPVISTVISGLSGTVLIGS